MKNELQPASTKASAISYFQQKDLKRLILKLFTTKVQFSNLIKANI